MSRNKILYSRCTDFYNALLYTTNIDYRRFLKIVISEYLLRHACPSIRPHGTTRPTLHGVQKFLYFRIFFSKIRQENSSFFEIWWQITVLQTQTNIRFTSYIGQLLLEWEMFRAKVVHKKKKTFYFDFFFENRAVCEIMWSNIADRGRTHMTI